MLADLAASIRRAGFDRLLIVNGHGGNQPALAAACAELGAPGFRVAALLYWTPGERAWRATLQGAKQGVGHACAYETALALALRPEHAATIAAAAADLPPILEPPALAGADNPFRPAGAAYTPHFPPTQPGYYGDPAAALRTDAARLLAETITGLAAFYDAFAALPVGKGTAASPG